MCSSLLEGLHARAIWSLSANQSALKVLKLLHKWEVEIKCSLTATMKNVHRWGVFYAWSKFSLLRFSWEQRHILLCTFWKEFEMGFSTVVSVSLCVWLFQNPWKKIQRGVIPIHVFAIPICCWRTHCTPICVSVSSWQFRKKKVWCGLLGILPKWGPRVIVWSCWRWLLVRQPLLLHHCWGVCLVLLKYTHGFSLSKAHDY